MNVNAESGQGEDMEKNEYDDLREELIEAWEPSRLSYIIAASIAGGLVYMAPIALEMQAVMLGMMLLTLWGHYLHRVPCNAHISVPVQMRLETMWFGLYRVRVWPQSIGWQTYQGQYTHSEIIWPWRWSDLGVEQCATLFRSMQEPVRFTTHYICYNRVFSGRYERPVDKRWYVQ